MQGLCTFLCQGACLFDSANLVGTCQVMVLRMFSVFILDTIPAGKTVVGLVCLNCDILASCPLGPAIAHWAGLLTEMYAIYCGSTFKC